MQSGEGRRSLRQIAKLKPVKGGFLTDTNLKAFEEINPFIREVGLQNNDSWHNKERRIYDFEMIFCFCGCAHAVVDGVKFDLVPGSLLIIYPNTRHLFWNDSESRTESFYCHFDFIYQDSSPVIFDLYNNINEYLALLFRENIPHPELIRESPVFEGNYKFPVFLQIKDTDAMASLFRKLYKTYISKSKIMAVTLKVIFMEIIQTILSQTVVDDSYTSLNHRSLVENMKGYIRQNYRRRISVAEIASSVNLCPDHASRIFKKVVGMKMVEFITRFRISKAKALMLFPNLTLEDIAHRVGFESENYFSQLVKKYEGQAPTDLRVSIYNEFEKIPDKEAMP